MSRVPKIVVKRVSTAAVTAELEERFESFTTDYATKLATSGTSATNADDDDNASQSSATLGRINKSNRKRDRRTKRVHLPDPVQPLQVSSSSMMVGQLDEKEEEIPVPDLHDLLIMHPNLMNALKKEEIRKLLDATGTGERGSMSQALKKKALKREQAEEALEQQRERNARTLQYEREHPFLQEHFNTLTSHLPNHRYIIPTRADTESKDVISMMMSKKAFLQVFTVDHENELLQEAGHFRHPLTGEFYDFPPCKMKEECIGRIACIRGFDTTLSGKGAVLMMYMTPEEYAHLLKTKQRPLVSRDCILDCRHHAQDAILGTRANAPLVTVEHTAAFQAYRNKCNEPGGYQRKYMLLPEMDRFEGFFDAIAELRISLLEMVRQGPEVQGRTRVLQDAMVYREPVVLEAEVGESREDFQQRSKAYHREYEQQSEAQQEQRLRSTDPRRALLRIHPHADEISLPRAEFLKGYRRFLAQFADAKTPNTAISIEQAYEVTVTIDSYIRNHDTVSDPVLPSSFQDTICEDTIRDMDRMLVRCCFWADTKGKNDKLVHIMCKLLPQPCQTRKFHQVCTRYMESTPSIHRDIVQWIMCAILGNYRNVPHLHRPDPEARSELYYLYRAGLPAKWRALVNRSPDFVVFCLRLYLIHCIEEHPVLRKNIATLFCWPRFKEVVMDVMFKARAIILPPLLAAAAARPGGALDWFDPPVDSPWVKELNALCDTGRQAVLRTSYQRQRKPLIYDFFNVCRNFVKKDQPSPDILNRLKNEARFVHPAHMEPLEQLVKMQDPVNMHIVKDVILVFEAFGLDARAIISLINLNCVYEREHAGKRVIANALKHVICNHPYAFALFATFCRLWRAHQWIQVRHLPLHYTQHQVRALQERYAIPDSKAIPKEDTEFLFCQGCRGVYSLVTSGRLPQKPCSKHDAQSCRLCNKQYEYGYDCVVVDFQTDKLYCSKAHDLRPPLEVHKVLAETSDPLAFVCWVRPGSAPENKQYCDPTAEDDPSKENKSEDGDGEDDTGDRRPSKRSKGSKRAVDPSRVLLPAGVLPEGIEMDLETLLAPGKLASRDRPVKVQRQELTRIPIIGELVIIEKRIIFLCPQQGCGRVAEYNAEGSWYNERGFSCRNCSDQFRLQKIRQFTNVHLRTSAEHSTCAICLAVIKNNREAFCYPPDLLLCRKHHSKAMVMGLTTVIEIQRRRKQPITRAFVVKNMIRIRDLIAEEQQQRNAKRNKQKLIQSRRNTHSRGKR